MRWRVLVAARRKGVACTIATLLMLSGCGDDLTGSQATSTPGSASQSAPSGDPKDGQGATPTPDSPTGSASNGDQSGGQGANPTPGDSGSGGNPGPDEEDTDTGGESGDGDKGESESAEQRTEEHSVTTQLDFGMPFAEDPSFIGMVGPYRVSIFGDRSGEPYAIAITLWNPTPVAAENLSILVDVTGTPLGALEAPEENDDDGSGPNEDASEEPTVADSDVPPISSVTASRGECDHEAMPPLGGRVTCSIGTLAPEKEVSIRLDLGQPLYFTVTLLVAAG
jgi:hypothetical protein